MQKRRKLITLQRVANNQFAATAAAERLLLLSSFLQLVFLVSFCHAAPSFLFQSINQTSAFGVYIYIDNVLIDTVDVDALQTEQVPLPSSLTPGTHTLKIQRYFSDSATLLAGYQILFQPQVRFTSNGTPVISDLLNQIRSSAQYTITVKQFPEDTWGALTRVDFTSGNPIYDYLVAVYGNSIVLFNDLTVAQDGTVTVNATHPLNTVSHVGVFADADSFNKYIGNTSGVRASKTFTLTNVDNAEDNTVFTGGDWFMAQQIGSNTNPVQAYSVNFLYAIYRAPQTTSYNYLKVLTSIGTENQIPPHILYGIAYQETQWNQFKNDDEKTLISNDGGIGLMQLTQDTALDGLSGPDAINQLGRLAADPQFNAEAGAETLLAAKESSEQIGNGSNAILENWYYAIWFYNGPNNNPNNYEFPYQESVMDYIANGEGRWTPVTISPPNFADVGDGSGEAIAYTPLPAHLDSNFNGNIQTIRASFGIAGQISTGGVLKVTVTNNASLAAGNVQLNAVQAIFSDGSKLSPTSLPAQSVTLNPRASTSYSLSFPGGGTPRGFTYQGSYTTGNFSGAARISQ